MSPASGRTGTPRVSRRGMLLGAVGLAGTGSFALHWFNVGATVGEGAISVQAAHEGVQSGALTLVDVRRPDEWARTGVPRGAVPLDMRRDDFFQRLRTIGDAHPDRPIAMICARGVRSAALTRRLGQAGFANILNVPEGMLGSGAGPGWLSQGLPVDIP